MSSSEVGISRHGRPLPSSTMKRGGSKTSSVAIVELKAFCRLHTGCLRRFPLVVVKCSMDPQSRIATASGPELEKPGKIRGSHTQSCNARAYVADYVLTAVESDETYVFADTV